MSEAAGYRFVDDVTSDVSFVARADTLSALFEAAGEAVLAATIENPEAVRALVRHRVELAEADRELLLLRFLNELVYLRDADGLLLRPEQVSVEYDGGRARLVAELVGEPMARGRHLPASDVKAVTAHGLRIARVGEGYEASVTLDV